MPADRRVLGPLDTDTAPESVANGRSAALRNVQLERGYATTVRGNVAVGALAGLPGGTSRTVGACLDPEANGVVWLVWNSTGAHTLVRWLPGQASPVVLLSWAGLNLPAQRGLTHACLLDGLFLFLDAAGAVRSVNLARAAAGTYTPALLAADPYALHLVKQPPLLVPTLTRGTNTDLADPRHSFNLTHESAWQFALRYRYLDGELTPLGTYSAVLQPGNAGYTGTLAGTAPQPTNFVRVAVPAPPPLVEVVELYTRENDSLGWLLATELRRPAPGVAFATTYDFYGQVLGSTIAAADVNKLAEAIPVAVGALAVADSRVLVGDCTEGRAAISTSLQLVAALADAAGIATQRIWRVVRTETATDGSEDTFYLFIGLSSGAYPDPASTYTVLTQFDRATQTYLTPPAAPSPYAYYFTNFTANGIGVVNVVTDLGQQVLHPGQPPGDFYTFRSRGVYTAGIQYFDALGRPGGAVEAPGGPVYVPALTGPAPYDNPRPRYLAWTLPTTDPALLNQEIPAWAESYVICLGRTIPFFLQVTPAHVAQFIGYDNDGKPQLLDLPAIQTNGDRPPVAGKLWLDIGASVTTAKGTGPNTLGYVWVPGSKDQVRFIAEDLVGLITGQVGDNLEVAYIGPRPLTDTPRIEIFAPAQVEENLTLYEASPRYLVTRTGTGSTEQRRYGTSSGYLVGDCALVERTRYDLVYSPVPLPHVVYTLPGKIYQAQVTPAGQPRKEWYEAMSPLDTRFSLWLDARRGRPASVIPGGSKQVRRKSLTRFSGVKYLDNQLNGLSQWDALSQKSLPLEAGAVIALRLAAQGQSEGQTLIALQERGPETLYLGQVPLRVAAQQEQSALVALTDAVIGGSNALRGGFGTRHPGSVVGIGGRLFWWCADQGEICRYAADGVNPLNTQHACRAAGQQWARTYATAEVVAGYDPRTQEYVLCFGATTSAPALTVRFSERVDNGQGGFVGSVDMTPEAVVGSSDTFYAVQASQLWRFTDEAPRLTWFGAAHPARASVWANHESETEKTWLGLRQKGGAPLWELVAATTPEGQATAAPAAGMVREGSQWVGPLLFDSNSAGFTGTDAARRALYEGTPVQSAELLATVECADTSADARLVSLTLTYTPTSGQTAP